MLNKFGKEGCELMSTLMKTRCKISKDDDSPRSKSDEEQVHD